VHHSNAAVVCTREDRREVLVVSRPGGREDGRLELQNLVDPSFRPVHAEAAGLGNVSDEPPARVSAAHPGADDGMLHADELGEGRLDHDSNAALPGNRQSDEAPKQRDRAP
jgi:hypothetical protein